MYSNSILLLDIKPFYECNLSCRFCHEKYKRTIHKTKISKDYLIDFFTHCIKRTKQLHDQYQYDQINVSLMGGELFQDRFKDDIIECYDKFISDLQSLNTRISINLVTNLVYKNVDRLITLAINHKDIIHLQSSFDFDGRYTKDYQPKLFLENCLKIKQSNLDLLISIVLHKHNIDVLLGKEHKLKPIFNKLYECGFDIATVMYYNNDKYTSEYSVSFKDMVNVYKYMIDWYPKLIEIRNLYDKINSNSKTDHNYNIIHSLAITSDRFRFKDWTDKQASYSNINCVTCKYYNCCTTDYGVYNKDTTLQFNDKIQCFDEILFQYIENKL